MNDTLFYVFGLALTAFAVLVSFVGLRSESFPSGALKRATILVFAVLVAATTFFGVANARDEQEHHRAELADKAGAGEGPESGADAVGEVQSGGEQPGGGAAGSEPSEGEAEVGPSGEITEEASGEAGGPGGTLTLTASTDGLAYDKTSLTSKPGEVTIELVNPSPVPHDVALERDGDEIGKSDLVAEGETSLTASLESGSFVFFCSVPGHRESGMEGTLEVK